MNLKAILPLPTSPENITDCYNKRSLLTIAGIV